jgi:hypothetical protein
MYAQSFFVSSGRDSGCEPTMAASLSSGWTGLMKAGFGLRLEGFLFLDFVLVFRIAVRAVIPGIMRERNANRYGKTNLSLLASYMISYGFAASIDCGFSGPTERSSNTRAVSLLLTNENLCEHVLAVRSTSVQINCSA